MLNLLLLSTTALIACGFVVLIAVRIRERRRWLIRTIAGSVAVYVDVAMLILGFVRPRSSALSRYHFLPWELIANVSGCAAALLTAALCYLAARHEQQKRDDLWKNGCRNCSYDLTGNTSGICPECGKPIPEKAEAKA